MVNTLEQPFTDFNELYLHATAVQERMASIFAEIRAEFDCVLDIPAAPKSRERALQKVREDYGGKAEHLVDLSRISIVVAREKDVPLVYARLAKMFEVARVKDRFTALGQPLRNGYRDYLVNVAIPVVRENGVEVGFIAEVQVHWKPLYQAKNGIGHLTYEHVREVTGRIKEQARPGTPDEITWLQWLLRAETAHFSNAARPPRTPREKALRNLEDRATVDVIGTVAMGSTVTDSFRFNMESHLRGEFTKPGQALAATHEKSCRDIASLLAAYTSGLGEVDDARPSFARARIEQSLGINPELSLVHRQAALQTLAGHYQSTIGMTTQASETPLKAPAPSNKTATPTASIDLKDPERAADHRVANGRLEYDVSWVPATIARRIRAMVIDPSTSVTRLELGHGLSITDSGRKISLFGSFGRAFAKQLAEGIARLRWGNAQISGSKQFRAFFEREIQAAFARRESDKRQQRFFKAAQRNPQASAMIRMASYVAKLEDQIACLTVPRPVAIQAVAPGLAAAIRRNQQMTTEVALARDVHASAGWLRRAFSANWKSRAALLDTRLAALQGTAQTLYGRHAAAVSHVNDNSALNRRDRGRLEISKQKADLARMVIDAIRIGDPTTISAVISGRLAESLAAGTVCMKAIQANQDISPSPVTYQRAF